MEEENNIKDSTRENEKINKGYFQLFLKIETYRICACKFSFCRKTLFILTMETGEKS